MRTRQNGRASLDGNISLERLKGVSTPTRRKNVRTAPRTEPSKAYSRKRYQDDDTVEYEGQEDDTPGRRLFSNDAAGNKTPARRSQRSAKLAEEITVKESSSNGYDSDDNEDNNDDDNDGDERNSDSGEDERQSNEEEQVDNELENNQDDESEGKDDDEDVESGDGGDDDNDDNVMDVDSTDPVQASGSGSDSLFVVDKVGDKNSTPIINLQAIVDQSMASFLSQKKTSDAEKEALTALPTALDAGIDRDDLYIHFANEGASHGAATLVGTVDTEHERQMAVEEVKRTQLEKKGPVSDAERKAAKKKSKEPKDAGAKWFHMPRQIITPELEQDLKVVKLRNYLDPKKHYKTNDFARNGLPQFFQMGRVIAGSAKDKETRMVRREQSRTLVEELMKDRDLRHYRKAKFADIQTRNARPAKKSKKKIVKRKSKN